MTSPIYVSKLLAAASSTSVGSFSSASVVTLSCAVLDTARRITIVGASALNNNTFTITGLNQQGSVISEVIAPSTATPGVATTTQDFLKVTSVTLSCLLTSSGGGLIGTTTQGGTPWTVVNNDVDLTAVSFKLGITSASTVVAASFEYTMDYPFYNQQTGLWGGATPTQGPQPTISSLGSTATSSQTIGLINFPISAWRVTVTSSSSSAGSVLATVLQSGF